MARVRAFQRMVANVHAHPTAVDCGYQVLATEDGEPLLQISTFGSDARQSEPKVSQTLQFDRKTAEELIRILREAFPERKQDR